MSYPILWKCPNCSKIVKNNKSCPNCNFKFSKHFPELWNCPNCDDLVGNKTSCPHCEYPNNLDYPQLWHCNKCGHLVENKTSCPKCGFSRDSVKKSNPINFKLSKKDLFKKQNLILYSVGIIALIGILLLFNMPSTPVNELSVTTVSAGESFESSFDTNLNAESAIFEFISPNGKVIEKNAVKNEDSWLINDLVLDETGDWEVIISLKNFGSTTEIFKTINVLSSCSENSDCDSGRCCFGACKNVCLSNSDCDDGISYTVDVCNLPNSCGAYCSHNEPTCFSAISDDICPSNCNALTDKDCTNCPSNTLECDGECLDVCFNDYDCNDGNSLTYDYCIKGVSDCDNYCNHTLYSEMGCDDGYIRLGTECIHPVCLNDAECDDNKVNTADYCIYPGTINAYCGHDACLSTQVVCTVDGKQQCKTPVCDDNSDCDTGEANSGAYCKNPGSCGAYCWSMCNTGFADFEGSCLKKCTTVVDCAKYQGLPTIDCQLLCDDEDYVCLRKCFVEEQDSELNYVCEDGVCKYSEYT